MLYAQKIRLSFKILIADGSSDDKAQDLLSDKSAFPNVNYEYLRYPYDETLAHYYSKVVDVLSHVTTPYVALACNDDFYVMSGIRKALAFLESNSDYVSARGKIYQCMIRPAGSDKDMQYVYGPLIVTNPPYFCRPSIVDEKPFCRVRRQLEHYCTNFLDIQRTAYTYNRFKIIKKLNPKDLRFVDLLSDILTAADGKIYRGEGLFMLYQSNSFEKEGNRLLNEFPTYFDWMRTPWWHDDFKNLVEVVTNAIAKDCVISFDEASKQFKNFFFIKFYGPRIIYDLKQFDCSLTKQNTATCMENIKNTVYSHKLLRYTYRILCMLDDYRRILFSRYFRELKLIYDFITLAVKS